MSRAKAKQAAAKTEPHPKEIPVLKPSQVLRLLRQGKIPQQIPGGRYRCRNCLERQRYHTSAPGFHENGTYSYCDRCQALTLFYAEFPACDGYPNGFRIDMIGERTTYPVVMCDAGRDSNPEKEQKHGAS